MQIFSGFGFQNPKIAMFSTPFVLSFALLLSLPFLLLFAPHILPQKQLQISLPDELDDLALFRRAATLSATRHRPTSFSRLGHHRPKIAFLFLTNSDLTFSPLWNRFFHGNNHLFNIYIHADPTVKVTPPGGVFTPARFIAAKKTSRASPTLISAARRLLATALLDDPLNSFFALLSQHCIPLHSFRFVYHTIFASQILGYHSYRSFIEILDKEKTLWDRYTARGKNAMLPEVQFEQFRVGSQFFILTRRHALLVIKDRKLWRKFRLPCLKLDSCYPEEHYFPTLLSMEDPDGCTGFTLTRVNWTGSTGGHPHTYRPPEVSAELIHELRDSNTSYSHLFARKFSADCLDPLMELTDTVIFRD